MSQCTALLLLAAFSACQRTTPSSAERPSAAVAQADAVTEAATTADAGTAVPVQLTIRLGSGNSPTFPINLHILDSYPEFVATLRNTSNATLVLSNSPLSFSVSELALKGQMLTPHFGEASFVVDPGSRQDQALIALGPAGIVILSK